ncbi:ASKHA domain-containing protein [Desulfococcus sp.]|uniref:ASKHA domain-containing protein n=1 Tax=Desulfococcus sp. TaxID=2025834 RepID=UPI003D09A68E
MDTHLVTFQPQNRTVKVRDGESLLRAAMEAGVHINASCGGEGVCGKCRVIIEAGEVEGGLSERLKPEDREKGYRLACRASVIGDVTVRVPVESVVDASVLNIPPTPRKTARVKTFDLDELKEKGLFIPPMEKVYLTLPEPNAQDHLPDVTRLVSFLTLKNHEHRLGVEFPVIRKLPDILRREGFQVTATLARPVREDGQTVIINVQPGDTTSENYAVAVDIGTTTVYVQLIDLVSGNVLAEEADFNGQISYGEDVISRIMFAEKGDGLIRLHDVVTETINKLIRKNVKRAGIDPDGISSVTLAGNTTMTQLFLQVDPRYIRRSPYVPAASIYPPIKAKDLDLDLPDHVTALVYPQVSSYVGGDIVAGVMGSGLYRTEELTLFMDIGTNAEIVVGNRDWLACAACSAGPAFEGGGIEFGMRAAKGAIEDFSIDPVTFEPMNLTIGNVRPKGICGSGLINIVASLFEAGVVNPNGKYERNLPTDRVREREGIWEYVLVRQADTQIDRDIVLTEIDIENLIRAKGAIYSGCQTLLEEVGLSMQDLDRIYLAGGFGSYVDLARAMVIGLLPEMDADKITYIGNASLMGARMSALTNRIRRDVVEVTRKMTNFELSETPSYMDHYVASLFLPHTDLELFPRLKARIDLRRSAGR